MNVSILNNCPYQKPIVVLAHNPASTKPLLDYANKFVRHIDLIISGFF